MHARLGSMRCSVLRGRYARTWRLFGTLCRNLGATGRPKVNQQIENPQASDVWPRRRRLASSSNVAVAGRQLAPRVNQTPAKWLPTHGGQPQLLDIVCRELRVEFGMFAVASSWVRSIDSDDLYDAHERRHGIHGGESETSVMLHLHPDLVSMNACGEFRASSVALERQGGLLMAEGGIGFGWQAQDLYPSGAMGNAAAAD